MSERILNIPFYSISIKDIDMSVMKHIEQEDSFLLDFNNLINMKRNEDTFVKVILKNTGDKYSISVLNKHKQETLKLDGTYKDHASDVAVSSSIFCGNCFHRPMCAMFNIANGRIRIDECMDDSYGIILSVLHAVRDYCIYRYQLKPKNYLARKDMYKIEELYAEYSDDAEYKLVYTEFPKLRDYLDLACQGDTHFGLSIVSLLDVCDDCEFSISEFTKILSRMKQGPINNASLPDMKEELLRIYIKLQTLLNKSIQPSIFMEDLDKWIDNNYTGEEYVPPVKEVIEETEEVTEVAEEPTMIEETVIEEPIIEEPIEEVVELTLPEGFSIVENFGHNYIHYPCNGKTHKRKMPNMSYEKCCEVAIGLNELLNGGSTTNKKAIAIYNSLKVAKDKDVELYESLISEYETDSKSKEDEIEQLKRENYDLKQQIAFLQQNKQTVTVESDVEELWDGELLHFISKAVEEAVGRWQTQKGYRRGYDVLKEYLSGIEESEYPNYVESIILDVFKSRDSFETKRSRMNSIGFELEILNNCHYKIYTINNKKYSYVLSSTPGDFRSYTNGIKDYIRILFR